MAPNQNVVAPLALIESTLDMKPDVEFRVFKDSRSYTSVLAHESILASSSSILKSQCPFYKNGFFTIVEITDFPPEILSAFLNFIYRDPEMILSDLDISTLLELSSFAEKYKVENLKEEILIVLRKYKVCQRNFLQLVKLLEDNKNLTDACKTLNQLLCNFITENLRSVEDISKVFLDHLSSTGTLTLTVPVWELFRDLVGTKKKVRFSEFVQEQTYRVDSAIVANSAKNKKKAEKKRKALERKNSESESEVSVSSVDYKHLKRPEIKLDANSEGSFEDSSNDSGMASSFEESVSLDFDGVNFSDNIEDDEDNNNPFKMFNEYIFNMDF